MTHARSLHQRILDDRAQMTVELCVLFPVVIVIALIAINALTFFGDCAQFDRISRNAVRIYAASPDEGADLGQIKGSIVSLVEAQMDGGTVDCETSGSLRGEGNLVCTLKYEYEPTLFGMPLRGSIFGVSLPTIDHAIKLAVDPYAPGKWVWTYMN